MRFFGRLAMKTGTNAAAVMLLSAIKKASPLNVSLAISMATTMFDLSARPQTGEGTIRYMLESAITLAAYALATSLDLNPMTTIAGTQFLATAAFGTAEYIKETVLQPRR